MGSVIDYIECPNCKREAYDDFYYKTGEEYISCNNCGYYKHAVIINRNKPLNELLESDWEISECTAPYGCYRLKFHDHAAVQCGTLESLDDLIQLLNHVNDNDVEYLHLSRFVDGEHVVDELIDNSDLGRGGE